jgi:hypothetical protein
MAHNGGRSQGNFWFLYTAGQYPFANLLKNSVWRNRNTPGYRIAAPDKLTVDGWPISTDCTINIALSQNRNVGDERIVIKWTGGGTIQLLSNLGTTLVSGSLSGTNGRAVITTPDVGFFMHMAALTGGNEIRDIVVCYEADEAGVDAGQIWNDKFIERLREANFGALRFVDVSCSPLAWMTKWEHRKPYTYSTWGESEARASIYAGVTTNSGADYSASLPGFVLEDKAIVTVMWNATTSNTAPTLNVQGTGAKVIKTQYVKVLQSGYFPTVDEINTLVYDAGLDCWMLPITGIGNVLKNGLPIEVVVDLCNTLGCHPWMNIPPYCLDPMTDFTEELATYFRDNLAPGLIPRFEPALEIWNAGLGFWPTYYAYEKAYANWSAALPPRWDAPGGTGSLMWHYPEPNPYDQWIGKVSSTVGQTVSSVYSGDRSRYQVICAGWASNPNIANEYTRWTSDVYVAQDGGQPAYDWVTHLAIAHYWNPGWWGTTTELGYAHEYQTGTASRKAEMLADYVTYDQDNPLNDESHAQLAAAVTARHSAMDTYDLGMTFYEGAYQCIDATANSNFSLTAISKAAQAVVTVASSAVKPPIGSQVFLTNLNGQTELLGDATSGPFYTVVSVGATSITLDVDSTTTTGTATGGRIWYRNSMSYLNTFRAASRYAPELEDQTTSLYNRLLGVRGEFPSHYNIFGTSIWSLWTDQYDTTPSTQWDAIVTFNAVTSEPEVIEPTPGGKGRGRKKKDSTRFLTAR